MMNCVSITNNYYVCVHVFSITIIICRVANIIILPRNLQKHVEKPSKCIDFIGVESFEVELPIMDPLRRGQLLIILL